MGQAKFKRSLGQVIYQLRKERNISQEQLALDAEVDRTRLGEIERGEANPTVDTLHKIAHTLGQTLGAMIIEAEDLSSGVVKKPFPTIDPEYINRSIPLPDGLTHEQLEKALNRTVSILNQIGLNPENGDIQWNIYSGIVSNIVTKAIAEASSFVQNKDTIHPDLYNPLLTRDNPDWSIEMKATHQIGKGGESHNPGKGWFMIVVYQIIDEQTLIVQVEVAYLTQEDWKIHERAAHSNRTRTAVTIPSATRELRQNSVYLDSRYATSILRKIAQAKD